jgi:hypothetical protein
MQLSESDLYSASIQAYLASTRVYDSEYEIYNSPLEKYLFRLEIPGKENFVDRMTRLGTGNFLDIGYSMQMLRQLQTNFSLHGLGIYILPNEQYEANRYRIHLIKGSIVLPIPELDSVDGQFSIIVSKNTFPQMVRDGPVSQLFGIERIWRLLKYDSDRTLTGCAYIQMLDPTIESVSGFRVGFDHFCESMQKNGVGIEKYADRILLIKTFPEPLEFPVTLIEGDTYMWENADR